MLKGKQMAKRIEMQATKREKAGKGISRALRREDRVPGVIYGNNEEPVLISLPAKEVNIEYNRGRMFNHLTDLSVDKDKNLVLARDVQIHPVTDRVLHVDYLRVSPKTKIQVKVPVEFTNEKASPGLEHKGVLNIVRHQVDILCPATEIPESIEADLTGLEIGDTAKSSIVKLPKGSVFAIQDREFTIATIAAPRRAIEEDKATEGEGEEDAAEATEEASENAE